MAERTHPLKEVYLGDDKYALLSDDAGVRETHAHNHTQAAQAQRKMIKEDMEDLGDPDGRVDIEHTHIHTNTKIHKHTCSHTHPHMQTRAHTCTHEWG